MLASTGPRAGEIECSSTHVPPFRNVNGFSRINNHCQLSFVFDCLAYKCCRELKTEGRRKKNKSGAGKERKARGRGDRMSQSTAEPEGRVDEIASCLGVADN